MARPAPVRAAALLATAFAAAAFLAPAAKAQSEQELYEMARKEGALIFFGSGQAETNERLIREFETKYPGIKVVYTGGFSNVFNQEVNKQLAAKDLKVDLISLQTVQDFHEWKKRGVLLNFKHEGFDQINPAYRDPDGAFTTIQVNYMSYGYNPKLLKPEDVPKSALDFLKPQFKGRIALTYPHDDDTTLFLFELLSDKYGPTFVPDLLKQEPKFVQGHLGVSRSIASGESLASFDVTSSADNLKRAGQPIERAFSKEDATPITTLTMGIFKDAPHVNAAKLYENWLMSKDVQSRSQTYSARTDVPPPAGLPDLKTLKVASNYIEFLDSEDHLKERRAKYEKLIGPVVGAGFAR